MEYSVANQLNAMLIFVFYHERRQNLLILGTRYKNMIFVYKYDISIYFIGVQLKNTT